VERILGIIWLNSVPRTFPDMWVVVAFTQVRFSQTHLFPGEVESYRGWKLGAAVENIWREIGPPILKYEQRWIRQIQEAWRPSYSVLTGVVYRTNYGFKSNMLRYRPKGVLSYLGGWKNCKPGNAMELISGHCGETWRKQGNREKTGMYST
jgi:hypothetical protein